jgi:nicotinamidase-related amidase
MKTTALLIIDVQQGINEADYWGGNRNNAGAEENIKALLTGARESGLYVFIIRHHSINKNSPFFPDKKGSAILPFVEPLEHEVLITKSTTNAFLRTSLQHELESRGVSALIVTGFVTNNSVEATVRYAAEVGFEVTVAADATATFDKRAIDGTVYSSELIHQVSLANLQAEYATIKTTQQILREMESDAIATKPTDYETLAKR